MAEAWMDTIVGALPHVPGFTAFGVAWLAFFKAGRGVGKFESLLEAACKEIEELKTRVTVAEKLGADLVVRLAEVPKRDEVRLMFAESREDTRAMIGELREDLRTLKRGA